MYPAREHVEFKPQRRWITYILYCQSVLLLLVVERASIKEEEEKSRRRIMTRLVSCFHSLASINEQYILIQYSIFSNSGS